MSLRDLIRNADSGVPVTLKSVLDNPNAYDTSKDDYFGYAVDISGDYAVVGAVYEDDTGGANSGKVYIFSASTGTLLRTLDNPNAYGTSASDSFGRSVAVLGDYVVVGAYGEGDAGGGSSGKVYIFSASTGTLLRTLDNPNAYGTSVGDNFGTSVSVSYDYIVVGASSEDDSGGTQSGKAYIFSASTGTLLRTLDNPNAYSTSASDYFGNNVSISGDYVVFGVQSEDDVDGTNSGKVYIFSASTGILLRTLDNPNAYSTSASDNFGTSVSISGDYVVVGTWQEDDAGGSNSGKAYIFSASTGTLLRTLDNPNAYGTSASDNFGTSVSISGDYVVVGAHLEDEVGGAGSGKVYIFSASTGTLLRTLDNPNAYGTSAGDYFGNNVSISGDYVVVGTYNEDDAGGTSSGKVYIFEIGV